MDTAQQIARTDQVALFALCSAACSPRWCWGTSRPRRCGSSGAFSLAVTVLDQSQAGLPSALLSPQVAAAATAASRDKGYLDGRSLAEVFAWLRPNDLIWNYWVNNYLLGQTPKPFDILYWNADPVRMTAALHRDFIELAVSTD
jgi:poly(3-hydroxyalkanoate) synthetase